MQNLIFAAYADNIQDKCGSSTDMYLQNACCCLLSAKYHNPEDQVSLITNCEIPTSYRDLLTASIVIIMQIQSNNCNKGTLWQYIACFSEEAVCCEKVQGRERSLESCDFKLSFI